MPFADHLPGDRTDDAGTGAGEQQRDGEDLPCGWSKGTGEKVVDAEETRVLGTGDVVERGACYDQDGAVDEEREGEEGDGALGYGVAAAGSDGLERGPVELILKRVRVRVFLELLFGGEEVVLAVEVSEAVLH